MEFSELFDGNVAVFSPNGRLLSCLCGDYIEVRYSDTLLKAFKFECGDIIKTVKWSGDSLLLLCHAGVSGLKLFSIVNGSCIATLRQQTGSISHISWTADFRTIFFMEPLLFRVAVWKTCDHFGQPGVTYLNDVQPWAKPSVALSPNGKQLALVTSRILDDFNVENSLETHSKDSISIFSAISWRKERTIKVDGIRRVGGITWSPNSKHMAVWPSDTTDAVLFLCIRSATTIGKWQSSVKLWPGVNTVEFSPSAQFLAIIGHNSKVHILNCVAWCEEFDLVHNATVTDSNCKIYREVSDSETKELEILERPVSISFLSNLNKIRKSSNVVWSSGGRFLASCVALAPAVVWVWSGACSFKLCCVIVMKHPVEDFQWDPVHNILAVVAGQDSIMLWNADEGVARQPAVCTPVSKMLFQAVHLNWHYDGKVLAVSSQQSSTILELPTSKT